MVPAAISFFIFGCLTVLAELEILFDLSELAFFGASSSLVIWPFMLAHVRTAENQIAALESRPEDTTRKFWRSLQMGYRRRMKVSKRQGRTDLATFLIVVAVTVAGWTLFAVELLDKM